MIKCTHPKLTLLEGQIHPGGKDYVCDNCGQQFRAEPIAVGVRYGSQAAQKGTKS